MFEELDARRERLKKHMPLTPDDERRLNAALDPLFIYNSNALEGNTLSYNETIYIIKEDKTPPGKTVEEILEVKGQQAAIKYLREAARGRFELSEKLVREFHALLTHGLPQEKYESGQYKSRDNMVRLQDGSTFPYVSAVETPAAMRDLLVWYRSNRATLHPVELAAQFHYRFILIHPFLDGNGRTARLLTNLILLLQDFPVGVVIRADSHRDRYVGALRAVDSSVPLTDLRPNHPGLNFFPFVNFVAQEVLWLFDQTIDIVEGRTIVTAEDLAARVQRMERESIVATGFPIDESARQHILKVAVEETTTRLETMLVPMLDQANAGLRELSFATSVHRGPLAELLSATSARLRVVERTMANKAGMGGLIATVIRPKQGSLLGLQVPWNMFEVLLAAEPHRLSVWTILNCETDHGLTTNRGDVDDWSAHLSIPIEPELFRLTEVSAFLLKELDRFLSIVETELKRRQVKNRSSSSQ